MTSTKYIKGILFAQFAVPVGFLLVGLFRKVILEDAEGDIAFSSFGMILVSSMYGLIISIPLSLLIGVPLSFILAKFNILRFPYIFCLSMFVPLAGMLVFFGSVNLNSAAFLAAPTCLGVTIYWYYLRQIGALTRRSI